MVDSDRQGRSGEFLLSDNDLPKESKLFLLAQAIASGTPAFFEIKGPGIGDNASNVFMNQLRTAARRLFRQDYSERRVCGYAKFAFDFYFPDEATAVEVALSLRNPSSEYERDIFKCLLAIDTGCEIRQLVFITKPGGHYRQQVAGASAIAGYVERKFGINIEIRELCDAALDVATAVEYVARHQVLGSLRLRKRMHTG
jgi:hypothetical protein